MKEIPHGQQGLWRDPVPYEPARSKPKYPIKLT